MSRIYQLKDGRKVFFFKSEGNDVCELCGEVTELKPFGPNNKRICYNCGMKDREATEKRMGQILFEDPIDS